MPLKISETEWKELRRKIPKEYLEDNSQGNPENPVLQAEYYELLQRQNAQVSYIKFLLESVQESNKQIDELYVKFLWFVLFAFIWPLIVHTL